jgi:hypothetical protein
MGDLPDDDWVTLGAVSVATFNSKASTLADLAAASILTSMLGEHVPAAGIVLPDPTDRLMQAMTTILTNVAAGNTDGTGTVARIGTAEPLAAGQDTQREAYRSHGVERWTRGVSGGACSICTDLAGTDLPMTVEMYVHTGCGCSQEPVTD